MARFDARAFGAEGCDPDFDAIEDVVGRPAGLLLDERRLILVREEELRAIDEQEDAAASLLAWCDLLATAAGLVPLQDGVRALRVRS